MALLVDDASCVLVRLCSTGNQAATLRVDLESDLAPGGDLKQAPRRAWTR